MDLGLALLLLLFPHRRREDAGLLASDMVMKTANWYFFWVFGRRML